MASEPAEELPDDLEAWVSEQAADGDVTRAEVVRRLIAAHRLLDEQPDRLDAAENAPDDTDLSGASGAANGGIVSDVDDLEARVDELGEEVGRLDVDLDEKIAGVRERVVQVKRETDTKAPDDHDHPKLERRMDEGFENYEEVLEYLTERADDLADDATDRNRKLRKVATAVSDLRERVAAIERAIEERDAVAELLESANRQGVSTASCGSCGGSVDLGLLDDPVCPHCESSFDGVDPGGWFRSDRLTVGDPPALESRTDGVEATERGRDADDPASEPVTGTVPSESREVTGTSEDFPFDVETSDDAAADTDPSATGGDGR